MIKDVDSNSLVARLRAGFTISSILTLFVLSAACGQKTTPPEELDEPGSMLELEEPEEEIGEDLDDELDLEEASDEDEVDETDASDPPAL